MTRVFSSLLSSLPRRSLKRHAELLQLQPPQDMLDNQLSKRRAFQDKCFPCAPVNNGGSVMRRTGNVIEYGFCPGGSGPLGHGGVDK
jgi:hypothetical protein